MTNKTKLEKEWKLLEPTKKARKRIEDIKEKRDLNDYFGQLLRELKE